MTVPVRFNLPVVPVMLKPAALPTTLTPQTEAVCEIAPPPREPGNPEGLQFVPVHQSEVIPAAQQLPSQHTDPTEDAKTPLSVERQPEGIPATHHSITKSRKQAAINSVHQSEVIPAGQQLPSQHTDPTEGEHATSLSTEQQPEGMAATCHSITKSRKQAAINSEEQTSEADDFTPSETNQTVNSSDDESARKDVITTTQCQNSPAEDVIDRTEKAPTGMKQDSVVAKEDEQNSSDNDPEKAGGGRSNSSAKSNRAASSTAGKAASRTAPRKGSKVIINISGTTYFMSRKRWRQLHKQWYVLIQCLNK